MMAGFKELYEQSPDEDRLILALAKKYVSNISYHEICDYMFRYDDNRKNFSFNIDRILVIRCFIDSIDIAFRYPHGDEREFMFLHSDPTCFKRFTNTAIDMLNIARSKDDEYEELYS